ncbi:MAG: aldehyde dehydrogenase family protein, partial [Bacteroidota bacterium]
MEKLRNYVNGQYVDPISNEYLDNFEPATGEVYSLIPNSNEEDVNQAVEAAEKAFPIWSGMSVEERSAILVKVSEGIERRMDVFVAAESKDNGKPLSLARSVD